MLRVLDTISSFRFSFEKIIARIIFNGARTRVGAVRRNITWILTGALLVLNHFQLTQSNPWIVIPAEYEIFTDLV